MQKQVSEKKIKLYKQTLPAVVLQRSHLLNNLDMTSLESWTRPGKKKCSHLETKASKSKGLEPARSQAAWTLWPSSLSVTSISNKTFFLIFFFLSSLAFKQYNGFPSIRISGNGSLERKRRGSAGADSCLQAECARENDWALKATPQLEQHVAAPVECHHGWTVFPPEIMWVVPMVLG